MPFTLPHVWDLEKKKKKNVVLKTKIFHKTSKNLQKKKKKYMSDTRDKLTWDPVTLQVHLRRNI